MAFRKPRIVRVLGGRLMMLLQLLVRGGLIAIGCALVSISSALVSGGQLAIRVGRALVPVRDRLVVIGSALLCGHRPLIACEL